MAQNEPHVQRMLEEYNENSERLTKLDAFLETELYFSLDVSDRNLLLRQSIAMSSYLNILCDRLERAGAFVERV